MSLLGAIYEIIPQKIFRQIFTDSFFRFEHDRKLDPFRIGGIDLDSVGLKPGSFVQPFLKK